MKLLLFMTQCMSIFALKLCRNCKYYKPRYNMDYSSRLSECSNFGTKDIHTDEISYDFADLCRKDENKCGIEGKCFEEEKNVDLKILSHDLKQKSPYILGILLSLISCSIPKIK